MATLNELQQKEIRIDLLLESLDIQDDSDLLISCREEIASAIESKLNSIAIYIKKIQAEADFYQEESRKLAQKATRKKEIAKYLQLCIKEHMVNNEEDKLRTEYYNISLCNNSHQTVKLQVNESQVPEKYKNYRMISTVDKQRLAEDADQYGLVTDTETHTLIAHVSQEQHIRIN